MSAPGRSEREFVTSGCDGSLLGALGRRLRLLALLALAGTLAACASIPPGAGSNPADPWEVYNRQVFEINDRVDRALLKPVAQAYEAVLPRDVRVCINNVFLNLLEPVNAINNLLQGKPAEAMTDVCRLAVNSTIGLLGCFDVAAKAGAPRSNEDFGQTLGRWGLQPGPYFVLPVLGPSTVRDTFGRLFDFLGTDPLWYVQDIPVRNTLVGVRLVDTRASLLPAEKVLEAAALDRYQFIRDAYLQLRRNLVYDGNPPRLTDPDEDESETGESSPAAARPTPGQDQPPPAPPR
jgi:phospholipid-binding lipoprotein MlaA